MMYCPILILRDQNNHHSHPSWIIYQEQCAILSGSSGKYGQANKLPMKGEQERCAIYGCEVGVRGQHTLK